MNSVLIIGMGRFGRYLALEMVKHEENEIMIMDMEEEALTDLLPYVTNSVIGDGTRPEVLEQIGVRNFDICFVCIGSNFQNSLEVTSLLKEMGAKFVVSKADRDVHAKFLLRNGADKVVYPDRDIAEKAAITYSYNHIYDYIELSEEYGIYEIPTPALWDGKMIKEADVRAKYHLNILGIKHGQKADLMPMPDYRLKKDEHLMVIGRENDIEKLLKKMK